MIIIIRLMFRDLNTIHILSPIKFCTCPLLNLATTHSNQVNDGEQNRSIFYEKWELKALHVE